MKILQVVQFFSAIHGGSAMVPYYISRELSNRGHKVTVFTSDFKLSQDWVDSLSGVEVHAFKTHSSLGNFYVTLGMINFARKMIKDYDIIHMHNSRTFQNILTYYYAKKYKIPYVIQTHGDLPRIMAKQRLKLIYDLLFGHKVLKNASKVIALNQVEAEQYKCNDVPAEKIAIIPNGINLSEYANLPHKGAFKKKFGLDENEKIVLYLGRIHQIKGIDILVRAFADIVEKLNDVKLVVVGPGDGYLDELETLIKALKIENNVLISGPLYGREKLEAYVDADVFVLPSRYETFPMSLLESYACAKPVICSKVFGLKDLVISGVTGFLFEPSDIRQLSSFTLSLLIDDKKAEEIGLEGKKFVKENFTIEKVVDRFFALYEEVLSQNSSI
jgi:glycosyltransferase involved in cell wall biosynthesis